MTKTKAQLRAEAVERLRMLDKYGGGSFEYAILGSDKMAWPYMDKRDALVDLLSDDCGPCYSCAKLAELRAENSQLRGIVGDLKAPTDPGEASMMSVDVFVKKQTEHKSQDSREKLEDEIRSMRKRSSIDLSHSDIWVEVPIGVVLKWLDRQASITEHTTGIAAKEASKVLRETIAELREDVAERDDVIAVLKAENAELKTKLDEQSAKGGITNLEWLMRCAGIYRDADYDLFDNEVVRAAERIGVMPKGLKHHHQKHSWLLAPHTASDDDLEDDGDTGAADADADDGDAAQDTREKLEADMRKLLHDAYMVAWEHGRENRRGSSFEKLLVDVEFYNLLDRQAAITSAECADTRVNFAERMRFGDEIDELQAKADELTAIAAQLCRACGFSMVDASGEVVEAAQALLRAPRPPIGVT